MKGSGIFVDNLKSPGKNLILYLFSITVLDNPFNKYT
jgi:hypothetical protein